MEQLNTRHAARWLAHMGLVIGAVGLLGAFACVIAYFQVSEEHQQLVFNVFIGCMTIAVLLPAYTALLASLVVVRTYARQDDLRRAVELEHQRQQERDDRLVGRLVERLLQQALPQPAAQVEGVPSA